MVILKNYEHLNELQIAVFLEPNKYEHVNSCEYINR